jgi:hypothetical protein
LRAKAGRFYNRAAFMTKVLVRDPPMPLPPSLARSPIVWWLAMGMAAFLLACGAERSAPVDPPPPSPTGAPTGSAPSPRRLSPSTIVAMGTGFRHACALRGEEVWCWGRQSVGRPNPSNEFLTPGRVDLESVANLTVHGSGACAVLGDGTVRCWGKIAGGDSIEPVALGGVQDARAVRFDERAACVLQRDDDVRCKDVFARTASWTTMDLPPMRDIDAARFGFCGLTHDGTVYGWTASNSSVSKVVGLAGGATAVACGMQGTTCATYPDGTAWCVGEPSLKPAGPRGGPRRIPVPDVQELRMSDDNAVVRAGDGSTWCWGDTRFFGLANHDDHLRLDPVAMTVPPFSRLFFGRWNLCGLRRDGALSCAGDDSEGQLGRGPFQPRASLVKNLPPVRKIVMSGGAITCVLLQKDELSCWREGGQARETLPATDAVWGLWGTCIIHPDGSVRCRDDYRGLGPWVKIVGMRRAKRIHVTTIGREDIAEIYLAISDSGAVYTVGHRIFSPARRLLLGRRFDEVGGQPLISLGLAGDELWAWETVTHILNAERHPIGVKAKRIARGVKRLQGACFQAEDDTVQCVGNTPGHPAAPTIEPATEESHGTGYLELLGRMGRPIPLPDVDDLPPDIVQRSDPCVLTRSGELWCWLTRGLAHPRGAQAVIGF